jgi:hypothetical protein
LIAKRTDGRVLQDSEATCWSIRQGIQQQLNDMRVGTHGSMEAEARGQVDARMQAKSISANLRYELQERTAASTKKGVTITRNALI